MRPEIRFHPAAAEIRDARGDARRFVLDANAVAPAYFGVVGLSVLRGRDFEPRDASGVVPPVIVSRAMGRAVAP